MTQTKTRHNMLLFLNEIDVHSGSFVGLLNHAVNSGRHIVVYCRKLFSGYKPA
jgi:hypothetical protein